MSTRIDQFSYAQKLAALTQLYWELWLRLAHALRAAEADLSQPEELGPVIQTRPALRKCRSLDHERASWGGATLP